MDVEFDREMLLAEMRSPLMRTLVERGFVRQGTDLAALDEACLEGSIPTYIGFDLTAPSLHVGSMIQLMALRHVRAHAAGGPAAKADAVNVLFGDATTRVGDPSDKNGARPILSRDAIDRNWQGIVSCVDRILGHRSDHFNSAWLDGLSFMDFLTGPAREVSLNRLMATDVVSRRMDAGLPMTLMELIYQSMQAMDFAELFRTRGVSLQLGGSDQWTNILAGVDLGRRMHGARLFGLTTPLMTDEQRRKMGKTADGKAVWLDPALVSSFDLWQFWRNVPDAKVAEFLGLFTELPMDEVRRLSALEGSAINDAKIALATEAVAIAHGREAADEAAEAARGVFSQAGRSDAMPTMRPTRDPRLFHVTAAEAARDVGLADSLGAARRLAAGGGLRLDGRKLTREEADADLDPALFAGDGVVLSAGKRHVRVAVENAAPLLPHRVIVNERPDGWFDLLGEWIWGEGDEAGPVTDILESKATREDAERAGARVRTAP